MLEYVLRLKDELSKEAQNAAKNMSGLNSEMGLFSKQTTDISKKMVLGIGAVGVAGVAYAREAVKAYNIQAEAEAKLTQLHMNRAGVTQENVDELKQLASEVQSLGVIGDEAIISGQAQLATFQLSTDAIKELTPAMADMVAQQKGVNATGSDFVNIGNLIGKVMEGQIGALGRYGVSFSDAQEEVLKHGDEVERAAMLAEVLAQNYGGVNEALRDTFEGQMQAAKNSIGDFNELIGKTVVEGLEPLVKSFNDWMDSMGGPEGLLKSINQFLEEHGDKLKAVSIGITAMLVPAFVAWAIAAGKAAIATTIASAPLIILGVAVGALAYLVITHWDEIKYATEVLKDNIIWIFTSVVNWFRGLPEMVTNALASLKDSLLSPFIQAWQSITGEISTWPSKLMEWGKNIASAFMDGIKNKLSGIKDVFSRALDSVVGIIKGNSPPSEGPLKEIDRWGFNIGDAWVKGFENALEGFRIPQTLSVGVGTGVSNTYNNSSSINVNAEINTPLDAHELAHILGFELQMRSRG